jgi:hypothetical protein
MNSDRETAKNRDARLSAGSYRHVRRGPRQSFCRAAPKLYRKVGGVTAWRGQHRWGPARFSCASAASSSRFTEVGSFIESAA